MFRRLFQNTIFLFSTISVAISAEDLLDQFSTMTRRGSGKLAVFAKSPALNQNSTESAAAPLQIIPPPISNEESDLMSFIQRDKKMDEASLNANSSTLLQDLQNIDTLIDLNLKDLRLRLANAYQIDNKGIFENLTNIELMASQYKLSFQTIYSQSQNLQDDIRHLIICYYCKNFSILMYNACQPNKVGDDHVIWDKKAKIFILNMKIFIDQLTWVLAKSQIDSILIPTIQIILSQNLIQFYNDSCSFFADWYTTHRSAWTKIIKKNVLGSTTRSNFDSLNENYRLHFNFLYDSEDSKKQLEDLHKNVMDTFERTDSTTSEALVTFSSWFSWGKKPNTASGNKLSDGWQ